MSIRAILITSFVVSLLALNGNGAPAQGPNTIKLVVPVAPRGAVDYVVRLLAELVQRANGKTIVVESRPGAGTAIGTEAVAHAAADGDTLLFTAGAIFSSVRMSERWATIR